MSFFESIKFGLFLLILANGVFLFTYFQMPRPKPFGKKKRYRDNVWEKFNLMVRRRLVIMNILPILLILFGIVVFIVDALSLSILWTELSKWTFLCHCLPYGALIILHKGSGFYNFADDGGIVFSKLGYSMLIFGSVVAIWAWILAILSPVKEFINSLY